MNKVNLTDSHPLILLSNLYITEKATLTTNLGKTSLAEGTARYISAFCLNYSSYYLEICLTELF